MNTIRCRDLGSSCRFEAKAINLEQMVSLFEDHARFAHDLKSLSLELEDQVRDLARKKSAEIKS